jgi:phosphatidylinositol alpha 1,6-mannosyltransferase
VVLGTSPGIGTQGQLLARTRGIPFAAVYTTDLPNYAEALVGDPSRPLPFRRALGRLARRGAWAYLRWLYHRRRTGLVLVPTEAARADFVANVPARAQVLGRGADTLSFPASPTESHDPVRLLYVGRVDYGEKNLRVLEEVVDRVEGSVLRVVGDGDDLPLMRERLADRIARGRVELTGRVNDMDRLISLYLSSDVFVFPSIYDTLGQVVLEAQRAGLPVVVRDRGGPPELVRHGETGFVARDDRVFVQRVEELVADEELRRRMGRAAREHAESLPGWSDVIHDLVGRLRALANGDPAPGRSAPVPSSPSERRASAL